MGTVHILTVCRCCQGIEEDAGNRNGENPIVKRLPAIEKEKAEETFTTTIPCPR